MIFDHFLKLFLGGALYLGVDGSFFSHAYVLIYVENVKTVPCVRINVPPLHFLTREWPAAGSKHVQTCQPVEANSQTHRLRPGELFMVIFLYFGSLPQFFEVSHIFVVMHCQSADLLNASVFYACAPLFPPLRSLTDDRPAAGSRLPRPPCRLPYRASPEVDSSSKIP